LALKKVHGIVLSGSPAGESDIISSIFTLEEGKERFIFKGLRKSRKRPRTAAEPASIVRINYYEKENRKYKTASEFDIIEYFSSLKEEKTKLFTLCFIAEILDSTIPLNSPDEKLYRFLNSAFRTLDSTGKSLEFSVFFLAHYMRYLGVLPDLNECSCCGGENPGTIMQLNNSLVAYCEKCCETHRIKTDFAVYSLLKRYTASRFSVIETENTEKTNMYRLFLVLVEFIESYFSIKLKSKGFLTGFFKE